MQVVFVTEIAGSGLPIRDAAARYRCYHPAELIVKSGGRASVVSAYDFRKHPLFDADTYVFHRPNLASPDTQKLFGRISSLGRQIIADYDDLIFGDAEAASLSSAFKSGAHSLDAVIASFARNLDSLRHFKNVSVSTGPLRDQVLRYHQQARVTVVPNFIPPSLIELHSHLRLFERARSPYRIGYFPGTATHDRDFETVAALVTQVLDRHAAAELLVVGPLKLPKCLVSHARVSIFPRVEYVRLPSIMSSCTKVIAPLEESLFNQCKSRVKYLESVLAGCELIASPIPDMTNTSDIPFSCPATTIEWSDALLEFSTEDRRKLIAKQRFAELSAVRPELPYSGAKVLSQ